MTRLTLQIASESAIPCDAAIHERDDEWALLSRAACGDGAAFDELVRRHEPHIRRLAFRLLGWRDDGVEDVVQDVFLAMLRKIGSFRGDSRLSTWLTAVTINRCHSDRRKRLLRLRWMRNWHESAAQAPADEAAHRDEINQQVRQAVADLSPADREVIALFYLEQMTVAEVASLLDARPNTIEVRLHRARERLRARLARVIVPDG